MQPLSPNANGVYEEGVHEVVARHGRAFAAVSIALCDDGLYRSAMELNYSHGGFSHPIYHGDPGYRTLAAARNGAIESLLRYWHQRFPSDTASVRRELAHLRQQIEARLCQPSLF